MIRSRAHAWTREQRIALTTAAVVLAVVYVGGMIAYTFGGSW